MVQNQQKMMKQLQEMQARMAQMQEELGSKTIEGSAGGGAVTATVNGHQQVISVIIDPDALDDRETLQEMIVAAVNNALDTAKEQATKQMSQLLPSGLPPGLF